MATKILSATPLQIAAMATLTAILFIKMKIASFWSDVQEKVIAAILLRGC